MQKSYVYKSVALHVAVVLLCVFDVPFLGHKRIFDEQPPIMVDLNNIKISDKTNIPEKAIIGKEKKPATRKERPAEKASAKKQELPPPSPIQKTKTEPKPEPKPDIQEIKTPSLIEEAPKPEEAKEEPKKESKEPLKEKKKPAPIPAKKPKIKPTAKPAATGKGKNTMRTANPLQSLMDSVDNMQQQIGEEDTPAQIPADEPVENLGIVGGSSQGSYFSELSISGIDFVKTKIQEAWMAVVGGKDDRNIEVIINVSLSKEGKLLSLEIEDQRRYLSDKYFQALADSAERAIRRAQAGSDVFGVLARQNGASYNDWKEIRFTFTPLGLAAK